VGPAGPAGAVGPANLADGSPLVYDANGTFLGTFHGWNSGSLNLYIKDAGLLLMLEGTGDIQQSSTLYTTPDCTGTPYFQSGSVNVLFANRIFNIVSGYVYLDVGNAAIRAISSTYFPGAAGSGECRRNGNPTNFITIDTSVVEAIPADLTALPFTLPVARPLTIQ